MKQMKKKLIIAVVAIASITGAFLGGRNMAVANVNAAYGENIEQLAEVEETESTPKEETTEMVEEKVEENVAETVEETPATTQTTKKVATATEKRNTNTNNTASTSRRGETTYDVIELEVPKNEETGEVEYKEMEVSNTALTDEEIEAIMNMRN